MNVRRAHNARLPFAMKPPAGADAERTRRRVLPQRCQTRGRVASFLSTVLRRTTQLQLSASHETACISMQALTSGFKEDQGKACNLLYEATSICSGLALEPAVCRAPAKLNSVCFRFWAKRPCEASSEILVLRGKGTGARDTTIVVSARTKALKHSSAFYDLRVSSRFG